MSTVPATRADAGGAVRRLGWGLADQSLSSLTNFGLSVLVARSVGVASLGAFGLAFTTYTVTLNAMRALCSEPLTVRYSATEERPWRDAAGAAIGTALVIGAVAGIGCVAAAFLFSGTLRSALLVLGVTMPGLMVQDAWRGAFFCHLRGAYAFANDLVWTIAQIAFVAAALALGLRTTPTFILAWAGAANVGAVFGSVQAGFLPRPRQARRWLTSSRDLGPRYMVEFVARSAALAGTVYATAAFAGLAAAGSLRAAQVALGPLNILNMGVTAPATAESVRIARRSPQRMLRVVSLMGVVLVVVFTAWGLGMYVLPDSIGRALLKRSWAPAHHVLLPYTAVMAASGMLTAATVGLRAMAAARRSMRSRLVTGVLSLSLATVGAITDGAVGASCGLAAGLWLGGIQWWQQLRAAVVEEDERRAAARAPAGSAAPERV